MHQTPATAESAANAHPVVIIGAPESVFTQRIAADWAARGHRVCIVTRDWSGEKTVSPSIQIIDSRTGESLWFRTLFMLAWYVGRVFEEAWIRIFAARYRAAMGEFGVHTYRPSVTRSILYGISIAAAVRRLQPSIVFGLEAFSHGLATAYSGPARRGLMVWGGDIYHYGESSWLALGLMKHVLNRVDLVHSSSAVGGAHVQRRYGVPAARVAVISLGVDSTLFAPAPPAEKQMRCARFGVPADVPLVMNVRKFLPRWGSLCALEAFIQVAQRDPAPHFVLLSDSSSAHYRNAAATRLQQEGLTERFTFTDRTLTQAECAELMSVADVATSLVTSMDLRSSSLLEATASGAALVLGEQPEYRAMQKEGMCARFVDSQQPAAVAQAILDYLYDSAARDAARRANRAYITAHEEYAIQMDRLYATLWGQ